MDKSKAINEGGKSHGHLFFLTSDKMKPEGVWKEHFPTVRTWLSITMSHVKFKSTSTVGGFKPCVLILLRF